jgi:hypothetical protein
MGASTWHYFTTYLPDINVALQGLREKEFRAGRYGFDYWISTFRSSSEHNESKFPNPEVIKQSPSVDELIEKHSSLSAAIDAILEESGADGTKSILDIESISDTPEPCAACPLSEDELQEIFKTVKPTREVIEAVLFNAAEPGGREGFWGSIARGEGRYIIVYQEGQPTEIFFAGYSFD